MTSGMGEKFGTCTYAEADERCCKYHYIAGTTLKAVDSYFSKLYGGGPLSEIVGNKLMDDGISIFILYGW